ERPEDRLVAGDRPQVVVHADADAQGVGLFGGGDRVRGPLDTWLVEGRQGRLADVAGDQFEAAAGDAPGDAVAEAAESDESDLHPISFTLAFRTDATRLASEPARFHPPRRDVWLGWRS